MPQRLRYVCSACPATVIGQQVIGACVLHLLAGEKQIEAKDRAGQRRQGDGETMLRQMIRTLA